jgi:hypothetical protein
VSGTSTARAPGARRVAAAAVALLSATLLVGCASSQPAPEPETVMVVDVPPAPPGPAPIPSVAASASGGPSKELGVAKEVRATTAMPFEGDLDKDALVAEINRQLGPLDACVALIRRTDSAVGSLNVRISVSPSGALGPKLESPVNPEAERCLVAGLERIRVTKAGKGRAMLLLTLQDER